MRSVLVLAALAGCHGRYELQEAPIVGGSDEQRAIVREELARFDALVGPGRLRISGVVFRSLPEHLLGRARTAADRVQLDEEIALEELPEIVRHELCHTLDYEEDLVEEPVEAIDRIGRLLKRDLSERARRGEALAQLCGVGAGWAIELARGCPDDPPFAAGAAAFVLREVWSAIEPEPTLAPIGPAVGGVDVPKPLRSFSAQGTEDPDVVQLHVTHADGTEWTRYADLDRGTTVDEAPRAVPLPEVPEPGQGWGWADGPRVAVAVIDVSVLGFAERRLVAWEDELGGIVPDSCLDSTEHWSLFAARDRVWFAWSEGQTVGWAPIGP